MTERHSNAMNTKLRVLVIGPDERLFGYLQTRLSKTQTEVWIVSNIETALCQAYEIDFALILLQGDIRENAMRKTVERLHTIQAAEVLVVSKTGSVKDKIAILDAGAVDVMVSPYDMGELYARVNVQLRHFASTKSRHKRTRMIRCSENFMIDTYRRRVHANGKEIKLSPKEYTILLFLVNHKNQVLSYKQIYEHAWRDSYYLDKNLVHIHICKL